MVIANQNPNPNPIIQSDHIPSLIELNEMQMQTQHQINTSSQYANPAD
jgi:hypothetical protein